MHSVRKGFAQVTGVHGAFSGKRRQLGDASDAAEAAPYHFQPAPAEQPAESAGPRRAYEPPRLVDGGVDAQPRAQTAVRRMSRKLSMSIMQISKDAPDFDGDDDGEMPTAPPKPRRLSFTRSKKIVATDAAKEGDAAATGWPVTEETACGGALTVRKVGRLVVVADCGERGRVFPRAMHHRVGGMKPRPPLSSLRRVFLGPYWRYLLVSFAVLTTIPLVVYGVVLADDGAGGAVAALRGVGASLAAGSVLALLCAAGADPGIHPRHAAPPAGSVGWTWSEAAHSYRPAGVVFCSHAHVLVEGYDHFCPWCGTVIAAGNYNAFVGLTTLTPAACALGVAAMGGAGAYGGPAATAALAILATALSAPVIAFTVLIHVMRAYKRFNARAKGAARAAPEFTFVVPPNAAPGASVKIRTPDGQQREVKIPPGSTPGASVTVAIPDATPTAAPADGPKAAPGSKANLV